MFHHCGKTAEGYENQCIGHGEAPVCIKGLVKSKYSSLLVVEFEEFEQVWSKCIKSITDLCKKLHDVHIIID